MLRLLGNDQNAPNLIDRETVAVRSKCGCSTGRSVAFATWSVKYDLWRKMRFFFDMLHSDIEGERSALQRGPVSLLSMLPKEFTREEVKALRKRRA